jgi:hypothetical protein
MNDLDNKILNQLKMILNNYINECNDRKNNFNKLECQKDTYSYLVSLLNEDSNLIFENRSMITLLMDTIYNNKVMGNNFLNIIQSIHNNNDKENNNNLKQLKNSIEIEYKEIEKQCDDLINQINRNKNILSSVKRMLLNFNYLQPVGVYKNETYDIENLHTLVNYAEITGLISERDQRLIKNFIFYYNDRVKKESTPKYKIEIEQKYNQIPNILLMGFEETEKIDISPDKIDKIDKMIENIYNQIMNVDTEDVKKILEEYKNIRLENNEYKYIVISILNKLIDDILSYYEMTEDKELFFEKDNRKEIITNYYDLLNKYLVIKKINDSLEVMENEIMENEEETIQESADKKTLVFSSPNFNPLKAKIISDMDNIPYEYYEEVQELLTDFKEGENTMKKEFKTFKKGSGIVAGLSEMKGDQIRIIYKHIKDNIYCIIGAFTKKGDNDRQMYTTMGNRLIPDTSSQEKLENQLIFSKEVEKEFDNLVSTKSRKGNR